MEIRRRARCLVLGLAALGFALAPVRAQQEPAPAGLSSIPYGAWAAAGERKEIAWSVRMEDPYLSFHQRLRMAVFVQVSGDKLQKGSVERDLVLLVKLKDASGRWLPDAGLRTFQIPTRLPKRTEMGFAVDLFVRPGEYTVAVFLYDRVTGQRSVALRKLRVRPTGRDPLLEAGSRLPAVEFLPPIDTALVADHSYLAGVHGKLELPVRTRRRLHVEILANFSASEKYSGSRYVQTRNFSILLPTLKLLSRMDLPNGSLTVTALDLNRQVVFFQQQNVRALEWPRLRESLSTLRTDVVDVNDIKEQTNRAAFFREMVERRLNAPFPSAPAMQPAHGDDGASEKESPLRVLIVLGQGILFPRGSDLTPVTPPENCACRVYYVQYGVPFLGSGGFGDELQQVLKPFQPMHYKAEDAVAMRKAIAAILEDLRAL